MLERTPPDQPRPNLNLSPALAKQLAAEIRHAIALLRDSTTEPTPQPTTEPQPQTPHKAPPHPISAPQVSKPTPNPTDAFSIAKRAAITLGIPPRIAISLAQDAKNAGHTTPEAILRHILANKPH